MKRNYLVVADNHRHQWQRTTLCQKSRVLQNVNKLEELYDITESLIRSLNAAKEELKITYGAHTALLDDAFYLERQFKKRPVIFNKPSLVELDIRALTKQIESLLRSHSYQRIRASLKHQSDENTIMLLKRSITALNETYIEISDEIKKCNMRLENMVNYHKTLSIKVAKFLKDDTGEAISA